MINLYSARLGNYRVFFPCFLDNVNLQNVYQTKFDHGFFSCYKKEDFFSLHESNARKSLLNSLLVLCVFVKMNLFLLDSVDKKN